MFAVVSDIHSNIEALSTVLDDIEKRGIKTIYCLGDVVGYGPNPKECLDLIIDKSKWCILGNHDQAAMFDPDGFNPIALQAVYWTREQLDGGPGGSGPINRRWDFLGELPRAHSEGDFLFVHGSPRDPTNEYVFPEDIYNRRKLEKIFALIPQHAFQGHTHVPGVFTESCNFLAPEEIECEGLIIRCGRSPGRARGKQQHTKDGHRLGDASAG